MAQIKVLSWDGSNLTEKDSQEWVNDYLTEVKCISLNDVDGNGKVNLVASGTTAAFGSFNNASAVSDRGQLWVWDWSDGSLVLMDSVEWSIDDGVCAWNVVSSDLDGKGIVEVVTVGCVGKDGLCDPNMRIWSILQVNQSENYFVYLIVGVLIAFISLGALLLWSKRSKTAIQKTA